MSILHGNNIERLKKNISALAVKIGLAVKKNLTTCRKKRIGFSEQKKKKIGWVLLSQENPFWISYGIATAPGAYRGDIIFPMPLARM